MIQLAQLLVGVILLQSIGFFNQFGQTVPLALSNGAELFFGNVRQVLNYPKYGHHVFIAGLAKQEVWLPRKIPLLTPACGGSILGEKFILTSATCIKDRGDIRIYTLNDQGTDFNVPYKLSYVQIHPNFDSEKRLHDLAILKLKKRIKSPKIKFVSLPSKKLSQLTGKNLFLVGEGFDKKDPWVKGTGYLVLANLTVRDAIFCKDESFDRKRKFFVHKHESIICATTNNNRAPVPSVKKMGLIGPSDSGSALFEDANDHFVIHGVAMDFFYYELDGSLKITRPAFYTRVSHYVDWIKEQMARTGKNQS